MMFSQGYASDTLFITHCPPSLPPGRLFLSRVVSNSPKCLMGGGFPVSVGAVWYSPIPYSLGLCSLRSPGGITRAFSLRRNRKQRNAVSASIIKVPPITPPTIPPMVPPDNFVDVEACVVVISAGKVIAEGVVEVVWTVSHKIWSLVRTCRW